MPKITQYPAVTTPADTDVLVVVQAGVTKKVALSALKAAMFAPYVKHNLSGAAAPGAGDDAGDGYGVNSIWIHATASPIEVYRCVDATEGAAIWLKTTLTIDELETGALRAIDAATAESDFLVGGPSPFAWVKKTLAEIKTILGLGGAVPTPTAENDVVMAAGSPLDWVKKTLADLKSALGLGSAAYTETTAYDAAGAATGAISGHTSAYNHDNIPPAAAKDVDMQNVCEIIEYSA